MSASDSNNFAKQQALAQKRISDLDDEEKMFLLKQEISNLRTQLGTQHPPLSSESSSSLRIKDNKHTMMKNNMGVLTVFLAVMTLLVVYQRRRTQQRRSVPGRTFKELSQLDDDGSDLTLELQEQQGYTPASVSLQN